MHNKEIAKCDEKIEELKVGRENTANQIQRRIESLHDECNTMDSGADYIQKERNELKGVAKELDAELYKIEREIIEKKETICEYQKSINEYQHKLNQKIEYVEELKDVLKIYGKQLERGKLTFLIFIFLN